MIFCRCLAYFLKISIKTWYLLTFMYDSWYYWNIWMADVNFLGKNQFTMFFPRCWRSLHKKTSKKKISVENLMSFISCRGTWMRLEMQSSWKEIMIWKPFWQMRLFNCSDWCIKLLICKFQMQMFENTEIFT